MVDVRLDADNVRAAMVPVREELTPLAMMSFVGTTMLTASQLYSATKGLKGIRNPSLSPVNKEAIQLAAVGCAIVIPLALYLRKNYMGARPTSDLDDAGPRGRPGTRYHPDEERY